MTGNAPILYSFRRCPYAMRARMAVLVSGIPVELREVALRAKPAEMLAASPKATVPVLVLPGGAVLDESLDIMRWALGRNDPEDWLGGADPTLMAAFDAEFKPQLDRYKYADRLATDPVEQRAAGLAHLATLEARLARTANLSRDRRALSDFAILPFVRQFAMVDPDWFAAQPIPLVQAWLARHLQSPLFASAMLRVPPWRAGDAPVMLTGAAHPPG